MARAGPIAYWSHVVARAAQVHPHARPCLPGNGYAIRLNACDVSGLAPGPRATCGDRARPSAPGEVNGSPFPRVPFLPSISETDFKMPSKARRCCSAWAAMRHRPERPRAPQAHPMSPQRNPLSSCGEWVPCWPGPMYPPAPPGVLTHTLWVPFGSVWSV
jgi:hypothetical protein